MSTIRFGSSAGKRGGSLKTIGFASLFVVITVLFVVLMNNFGKSTLERQQESLVNAVHRDIVQCYAIEGVYPPDLDYLKEHYGLTWDPNTFFVDYEPIASNLYPDVTVMLRRR